VLFLLVLHRLPDVHGDRRHSKHDAGIDRALPVVPPGKAETRSVVGA
jgi:hypothetical protein